MLAFTEYGCDAKSPLTEFAIDGDSVRERMIQRRQQMEEAVLGGVLTTEPEIVAEPVPTKESIMDYLARQEYAKKCSTASQPTLFIDPQADEILEHDVGHDVQRQETALDVLRDIRQLLITLTQFVQNSPAAANNVIQNTPQDLAQSESESTDSTHTVVEVDTPLEIGEVDLVLADELF